MITPRSIYRHFKQRRFAPMLDALAANDATLCPPTVRNALVRSDAGPTALGLRRLLELTRGPNVEAVAMTRALLDAQQPEGCVCGGVLATAAALAAWSAMLRDGWRGGEGFGRKIEQALGRALEWLAARQSAEGLFDVGDIHDTDKDEGNLAHGRQPEPANPHAAGTRGAQLVQSAWILALLAEDEIIRDKLRLIDLMHWLDTHPANQPDTLENLWRFGRARLAATQPADGALAA